jgi:two-component system chemotaxis response regulator CheY
MVSKESTILIVDDMKMARFLIIRGITEMGYTNYKEANDGEEAWKLLNDESVKYGMILSDWNMPKMNGLDFLHKVRAENKFKNIPFIMVTAEAETEQISQAISGGATDYMVKPFATDMLKQKMEKFS